MKRRTVVAFASLYAGVVVSTTMLGGWPAVAATPPEPAITEDARSALTQVRQLLALEPLDPHVLEADGVEHARCGLADARRGVAEPRLR